MLVRLLSGAYESLDPYLSRCRKQDIVSQEHKLNKMRTYEVNKQWRERNTGQRQATAS